MALLDRLWVSLVDDMSLSRGLIAQSLDALGMRNCKTTDNAKTEIGQPMHRHGHLGTPDYDMPDKNEDGLLQHSRRGETPRNIGFILVTGGADLRAVNQGAKMGMNNFLKKPNEIKELSERIEAAVGRL